MVDEEGSHAWGDYLKSRYKAMLWVKETFGYSDEEIAKVFSMDETQVGLILRSANFIYRDM